MQLLKRLDCADGGSDFFESLEPIQSEPKLTDTSEARKRVGES